MAVILSPELRLPWSADSGSFNRDPAGSADDVSAGHSVRAPRWVAVKRSVADARSEMQLRRLGLGHPIVVVALNGTSELPVTIGIAAMLSPGLRRLAAFPLPCSADSGS